MSVHQAPLDDDADNFFAVDIPVLVRVRVLVLVLVLPRSRILMSSPALSS
jgi:hypothetical protein